MQRTLNVDLFEYTSEWNPTPSVLTTFDMNQLPSNALPSLPTWAQQLAGILPLSAVIDFLNTPKVFHIFQLRGAVPAWCWPITPSGSRLLLASSASNDACFLDRYENGAKPLCLDGRYGDQYPMANAETIRMALDAIPMKRIQNQHPNIEAEARRRPQELEIVLVSRSDSSNDAKMESTRAQDSTHTRKCLPLLRFVGCIPRVHGSSILHNIAILLGWMLWIGLVICTALLQLWLALSFLIIVVSSGICVLYIHGAGPRRLGSKPSSPYNRVVITSSSTNSSSWRLFYGESSSVNALVNWPLLPQAHYETDTLVFACLRILIFGQWALAIATAAKQSLDAYVVAFWILFCVLAINFVFCTDYAVSEWMGRGAGIQLERYSVAVSSRRAMLNVIIALNPDTFSETIEWEKVDSTQYNQNGLSWLDPILAKSEDRTQWLEATRRFISASKSSGSTIGDLQIEYRQYYWWKFVEEGTDLAIQLRPHIPTLERFMAKNCAGNADALP